RRPRVAAFLHFLILLRSRGGGGDRRWVSLIVFLDKVVSDVGGLGGEEQNARLLGRAAFEHHHDATLLAIVLKELADFVVDRLCNFLKPPLSQLPIVLFLSSKDLLFLGRLINPLVADLQADSGALSIDLILKIGQGVILGLHLILLRLELPVEGVDLGLQLSDVGAELGGVDVSELPFGPRPSPPPPRSRGPSARPPPRR